MIVLNFVLKTFTFIVKDGAMHFLTGHSRYKMTFDVEYWKFLRIKHQLTPFYVSMRTIYLFS